MTKKALFTGLFILILLMTSCGSKDDECTKMVAIPEFYIADNVIQKQEVLQEMPCDFPEPDKNKLPPELGNFSYEVLYFTYIPDTGNNTSQLKFEIKLNNGNNYPVEGMPYLTTRSEELEVTGPYSHSASNPCHSIAANSSCILTFDKEYPIKPDVGGPSFMELVTVKYYVVKP